MSCPIPFVPSANWVDDASDLPLVYTFSYVLGVYDAASSVLTPAADAQAAAALSGVIIPAGDEAANNTVTAVGAVGDIYGAEAVSYAEIEARFFFVFFGLLLRRSFVRRRDEDATTQQPGAPDRTKPSLCVCCVSVPRRPITVSSTRRGASTPPRARARAPAARLTARARLDG